MSFLREFFFTFTSPPPPNNDALSKKNYCNQRLKLNTWLDVTVSKATICFVWNFNCFLCRSMSTSDGKIRVVFEINFVNNLTALI